MRALIACALLAGCVAQHKPIDRPLARGELASALAAQSILAIGKSSKADVSAMLGEATVVDFPSGYEVWVYRERPTQKPPAAGAELVLLFDGSGTLTRTRVTPLPAHPR